MDKRAWAFFLTSILAIGNTGIPAYAQVNPALGTEAYFQRVVEAIYKAEGGQKAKVPYGILSVKVSSKEEARRVCLNTVRNNYKRWIKAGRPKTYLEFLAARYAPLNAKNDPKGLNRNWLNNMRAFLK